nr:PREDICTED: GSK3-beta interaction protein [Struthio camelus australis]
MENYVSALSQVEEERCECLPHPTTQDEPGAERQIIFKTFLAEAQIHQKARRLGNENKVGVSRWQGISWSLRRSRSREGEAPASLTHLSSGTCVKEPVPWYRSRLSCSRLSFSCKKWPRLETDCNAMEMANNMGFEEDSDYRDFEGTDVKDMRLEAEAVVNDVLFAVSNMFVSKTLPCAEDVAYINVETRERNRYCLELTEAGLRVVAYAFDQTDDSLQTPYHETVYSLLDSLSPAYRELFGNALLQRLEALKKDS